MPDTHAVFRASQARRLVMVIEDEMINREILGAMLEEQYQVLPAEDGAHALEALYANSSQLSLVLLDLNLPDMHGLDILRQIKGDPRLSHIPVIVMTADREAEVESLTIGAIDFISKPYPMPEVVQARVQRTIELCEDRDIIRSTERDQLTGLYNKEYFYNYAEQFDTYHPDTAADAVVVDISHFRMINERYGRAWGDDVLRQVGAQLREAVIDDGGLVCRREADTFLVYCPHRESYDAVLMRAGQGLEGKVRLRMGVYPGVDRSIDVERRFDRAKMAADSLRNSFDRAIALYDNALHEKEIFAEQLLEDFPAALEQNQFTVYYQPKFDIRPAVPTLCSAEALVRWNHPRLGMVSPGLFIPLFESNGLIRRLDQYVWRQVAAMQREWKARLGICVPVSVNMSRVDMFDSDLVQHMQSLVREFDLSPQEMLLEITESAYTQNSGQIIETVQRLRSAGFCIEMDDFGSGYSSLSMLSSVPVDALKLDMQFVRSAFKERKDTRMLEVMIDIAASLGVPTIAEGVETAEQMYTLKAMGCDIVQGYYFSKPLPAQEYEAFLIARRDAPVPEPQPAQPRPRAMRGGTKFAYDALHDPLTGLYNQSACEMLLRDADQRHIAVLVACLDDYQAIRRQSGQSAADAAVLRAAQVLRASFRSVDYVCRISSDEFAVIVTRIDSAMRAIISDKVEQVNAELMRATPDTSAISLSVGVAFADREAPQGDIFHDADLALTRMKEMKKSGCAIY